MGTTFSLALLSFLSYFWYSLVSKNLLSKAMLFSVWEEDSSSGWTLRASSSLKDLSKGGNLVLMCFPFCSYGECFITFLLLFLISFYKVETLTLFLLVPFPESFTIGLSSNSWERWMSSYSSFCKCYNRFLAFWMITSLFPKLLLSFGDFFNPGEISLRISYLLFPDIDCFISSSLFDSVISFPDNKLFCSLKTMSSRLWGISWAIQKPLGI